MPRCEKICVTLHHEKNRPIITSSQSPVIIYMRLGQVVVRRRSQPSSKPRSPRQREQSRRFAVAVAAANSYASLLPPPWHEAAHRQGMTGLNLLLRHIMRHALATDPATGAPVVDHSKIDLQSFDTPPALLPPISESPSARCAEEVPQAKENRRHDVEHKAPTDNP